MKSVWLILALLVGASDASAGWDPLQKARRAASQGERHLAAGDTLAAMESWLKAQALDPEDREIAMGLGETLFRAGQYKSSAGQYASLVEPADPEPDDLVLYNAGTAAFAAQDLERALELYTQAVLDSEGPPDEDLLHNLELTQQLLEMAQQQQEQQQQQGDPSDSQDQEQQDQDQQQQQQEQGEQQEQQPQEEDSSEGDEQEEQQQPPDAEEPAPPDSTEMPPPDPAAADSVLALPEGMTPQEAMRLLDALDHDEEELRNSIQRRLRGAQTKSKKDW